MRTQISFRIEQSDLEKLRALAANEHLDLADILRRAVRELLANAEKTPNELGEGNKGR